MYRKDEAGMMIEVLGHREEVSYFSQGGHGRPLLRGEIEAEA